MRIDDITLVLEADNSEYEPLRTPRDEEGGSCFRFNCDRCRGARLWQALNALRGLRLVKVGV